MKIGIMDSGAGGLTILNAIRHHLPSLDLLYLADELLAPYGDKSSVEIQRRIVQIGRYFENQGVDAIVVACNTATVIAIDALRAHSQLPIIGVEPAVKPAFRVSKKRHVAVLATPLTAQSERLEALITRWREDSKVHIMSSPQLAFAIDGWPQSKEQVTSLVEKLCSEMTGLGVDTLVLACTHYPLIKELFIAELGHDCEIIEPSEGVTAQLKRRLLQSYPERAVKAFERRVSGAIELVSTKDMENMERLSAWVQDADSICSRSAVDLDLSR